MMQWYKNTYGSLPEEWRRYVSRVLCRYVSYTASVKLATMLLHRSTGHNHPMSKAEPFFRLLDNMGLSYDREDTARRMAMFEMLFPMAFCRLFQCPQDEFDRWVTVTGEEHLIELLESKPGILLMGNHYGPGHIFPCYFSRRGIKINIVQSGNFYNRYQLQDLGLIVPEIIDVNQDGTPGMLRTVTKVKSLLRRGEIVYTAVDATAGSGGVKLDWFGRERIFRTAMPLAAALTGAAVLPVFATLDSDGHIGAHFEPRIPSADPSQTPVQYAEYVVQSCVQKLQAYWRHKPGTVKMKWYKFAHSR